jgi:hypothetical protein
VVFVLREQYRRQGGGNENSENERFQGNCSSLRAVSSLLLFYAVIRPFYARQTGSTSQQQRHVRTGPILDVVISIKSVRILQGLLQEIAGGLRIRKTSKITPKALRAALQPRPEFGTMTCFTMLFATH